MARRADRPEFHCATCGLNLGRNPIKGSPLRPYTECGCISPNEGQTKMIRLPTKEEKIQAILDTVPVVADYLKGIDKLDAFNDFTKDDICGLIRACQEGVQASLHRQANHLFDGEVPF